MAHIKIKVVLFHSNKPLYKISHTTVTVLAII